MSARRREEEAPLVRFFDNPSTRFDVSLRLDGEKIEQTNDAYEYGHNTNPPDLCSSSISLS
jgi:hypothetical protein